MERKLILSELIQNDKFVSNEELDLVRGGTHPVKPTKGNGDLSAKEYGNAFREFPFITIC